MAPRRLTQAGPLLTETKRLLRRYGLQARKGLGQHFLVDEQVLGLILETAELARSDLVVEIGPGLGVLTRELAARAGQVIAVELDDRLAAALRQALESLHNVAIVNEDILKLDPATLGIPDRYKVAANLPYYITSAVLRHFLEASARPRLMVVMVQKEVAETIAAGPGSMSLLSVSVQFYGEPTVAGYVPARSFYPAPEVDSALLRIDVYPRPKVAVSDEKGFFGLVRAGFSASRKQLVNSLGHGLGLSRADVLSLLVKSGIEPRRRAETLTVEEWAQLWEAFDEAGESPC